MTTEHRPDDADDEAAVRPFAAFLHEQRNGALHAELSDEWRALLVAVREHGKAGSLTVTLKVKPAAAGNVDQVLVADDVTVKPPRGARGESFFFLTDDANLSRNDPRQQSFELREVPTPDRSNARSIPS